MAADCKARRSIERLVTFKETRAADQKLNHMTCRSPAHNEEIPEELQNKCWILLYDRLYLCSGDQCNTGQALVFFFTFFYIIKISVKLEIGNKSKYKRNFFFHILTQKFQKKAIFISLSLKAGFIYHSILQSFDLRIRKVRALIFKSTNQTY